jgi:hypothetical protein
MTADDLIIAASGTTLGRVPVGSTGQQILVRSDGTIGYVDVKINVEAWGAVGDGTTDDTTAIQNAINAASTAGGGAIEMPPNKTFKTTATLTPASNVSWFGGGQSTIIKPAGAISAILWPGTSSNILSNVTFRDFTIDGANQTGGFATATKGFSCPWSSRVTVDNCQVLNTIATAIAFDFPDRINILNCTVVNSGRLWTAGQAGGAGIGIGVSETASDQPMVVANCHIQASGSYGIFFESQDTFVSNQHSGTRIIGNYCTGAKTAGIGLSGSLGTIVTGNICDGNGTAGTGTNTANIAVDGGTLNRESASLSIITNNTVMNGLAHGILVRIGGASGLPRWLRISDNLVYNNGGTSAQDGHGIFLNGTSVSLKGITVDDNYVTQNKQGGIVLANGTGHINIAIRNNDVFSNGQTSGTVTDNIRIDAPVAGFQLTGNQCYRYTTVGNPVTGINLTSNATITNAQISGNDVRGNITNGMLVNGTVDGTVIIHDNPGYNPVGTLTVAVPATTVAVTAAQVDRTFYITAGAGTTTVAISSGPTITLTPSALNTVRVPAGQTLTPTYTNAPTWVVEGE